MLLGSYALKCKPAWVLHFIILRKKRVPQNNLLFQRVAELVTHKFKQLIQRIPPINWFDLTPPL